MDVNCAAIFLGGARAAVVKEYPQLFGGDPPVLKGVATLSPMVLPLYNPP